MMKATANPSVISIAWRMVTEHRLLLWQLVRRDIAGRYRGSMLGFGWALLVPMLLLAIYGFVFGVVFPARFPMVEEGRSGFASFALLLYCGLLMHGLLAEVLNRSVTVILTQPNLVTKVVFPLELLPVVVLISGLFHLGVGLVIMLAVQMLVGMTPGWEMLWLPCILLPYMALCAGTGWLLASLGVYVRDIGQLTGLLATALLFLSPVFYPLASLPEEWRWLMLFNPLTIVIEAVRASLFGLPWPPAAWMVGQAVVALGVAIVGLWWFVRVRKGFADVL